MHFQNGTLNPKFGIVGWKYRASRPLEQHAAICGAQAALTSGG
jgi:hypothetical protein